MIVSNHAMAVEAERNCILKLVATVLKLWLDMMKLNVGPALLSTKAAVPVAPK